MGEVLDGANKIHPTWVIHSLKVVILKIKAILVTASVLAWRIKNISNALPLRNRIKDCCHAKILLLWHVYCVALKCSFYLDKYISWNSNFLWIASDFGIIARMPAFLISQFSSLSLNHSVAGPLLTRFRDVIQFSSS